VTHSLVNSYRYLHQHPRPTGVYWFSGYSVGPYIDVIAKIVRKTGTRTILDYGCGKGLQYTKKRWHQAWGILPALYDPAIDAFSKLPEGTFDGVICTDVLEHIPRSELNDVISDLVNKARLWCFVTVCCRLSDKKFLPDGRNVHVTIMPENEWRKMLNGAFAGHAKLYLEFTP
jgi:hypothetical protein